VHVVTIDLIAKLRIVCQTMSLLTTLTLSERTFQLLETLPSLMQHISLVKLIIMIGLEVVYC